MVLFDFATVPRFSYGSGEWRSDRESWLLVAVQVLHKHGPCHPKKQLLKKQLVASCKLHTKWFITSKDAVEVQQDGAGRWFTFSLGLDSVILLEEKGLPAHICGLPCVGSPTLLPTVLHELEDVGEARLPVPTIYQVNLVKPIWSISNTYQKRSGQIGCFSCPPFFTYAFSPGSSKSNLPSHTTPWPPLVTLGK